MFQPGVAMPLTDCTVRRTRQKRVLRVMAVPPEEFLIAREARDTVPIVVDGTDRIVWIAGYEIDEAFRVTDPAQAVLILKLKALGGSA